MCNRNENQKVLFRTRKIDNNDNERFKTYGGCLCFNSDVDGGRTENQG